MRREERIKIYQQLSAAFPAEAIERTDGHVTGRGYSTTGIKYQYLVDRLLQVLGVGGFRIRRTVTVKEVATSKGRPAFEAICEICVELGEWTDGEFVVFAEVWGDGGHVALSEADARKGCFSNAFKKAIAFAGVGGEAYRGTIDDDNVPLSPGSQPRPHNPESPSSARQERNRLTSRQLERIWSLVKEQNVDRAIFRRRVLDSYGRQLEYLDRAEASVLIGKLMKVPEPEQVAGNDPAPRSGNGFDGNASAHGSGRR